MTEEKSSETQDQKQEEAQEKLLAGKFKSMEELEKAYKDIEKERAEALEALDREQRVNSLLASEQKEAQVEHNQGVESYSSLSDVMDEETASAVTKTLEAYRQKAVEDARNEAYRVVQEDRVRQEKQRQFYDTYSDLKGFEFEVNQEADLLQKELGDRAAKIPIDTLMKEVAKRTKDRLADQRRRLQKTTLHVEGSEVSEPEIKPKKEDFTPTTAEERTQAYFEELRKEKKDKQQPARR